jgi:putative SOS response-associated peptidase YedK
MLLLALSGDGRNGCGYVHGPSVPDFGEFFNVAPQTFQPVIRLNRDTGEREIVLMRWGLIPYWILLAKSVSCENVVLCPDCRRHCSASCEAPMVRTPADSVCHLSNVSRRTTLPHSRANSACRNGHLTDWLLASAP